MSNPTPLELLLDRVERLLLRHAELRRTNELLSRQLETLSAEHDLLKQRMNVARARVDALLERIAEPAQPAQHKDAA